MSKVRSRRGFLGAMGGILGFGAFEKRCMVEAGVSSPTALAQDVKYYAIHDDGEMNCNFEDIYILCVDKAFLEKMSILWNYDAILEGIYYDKNKKDFQFHDVICGLDFQDSDQQNQIIKEVIKKHCPNLLDQWHEAVAKKDRNAWLGNLSFNELPPRPDPLAIKAICADLKIPLFTVEEHKLTKKSKGIGFGGGQVIIVIPGNENISYGNLTELES